MLISDVKGELYLYTAENLKRLGYDVIAIDYINFLKSNKYNYLDIIINAIEDDNIPLAESLVSDMVNILVEKNDKTEPIWKNGEMSVIKTAIMAVVLENKGKREYQTLANAYYFVAEMFKTDKFGKIPIKKFYAVAGTAPSKTRGSFEEIIKNIDIALKNNIKIFLRVNVDNENLYDKYYRILNGSTQVNATEINNIPIPKENLIEEIGKKLQTKENITTEICDNILLEAISNE